MKGKTLLCLALVTSMLLSVFAIGPVGAQSTTIGVEPDKMHAPARAPGSWFAVEIWVRDVADLAGVDFKLAYNTTLLNGTSITYGGIFSVGMEFANVINDTAGYCWYSVVEWADPGVPFYGDGRVAIINFTVDSSGECALDLYDTELRNSVTPPQPISHTALDGYFSNIHILLHSEGGLIDLSNPVSTDWHELWPGYSNTYNITSWTDDDASGNLTVSDDIRLKNKTTGSSKLYSVDEVTVTLNTTYVESVLGTTTISPTTTSGGWTNPTGAYANGSTYASITSGTPSASQVYGGYGFNFPNRTINQVMVRYDAWSPGSSTSLTLKPNLAGDETSISTVFPAAWAHWSACTVDDVDSSYVEDGGTNLARDLYNLGNAPTGTTGTINSVTVYVKVRGSKAGIGAATTSIKTLGAVYDGTPVDVTDTYSTFSTIYTLNPNTSAAWTWSQVNALQAGVQLKKPAGGAQARATYVWVVVDYVAANEQIRVDVSWDGGTSWSAKQVTSLTFSETTYWYDVTGAISWTAAKLNDTNFRTRVDANTVGTAAEVRLDWIPVRVDYTAPVAGQNLIEFEGSIQDFNWTDPASTRWHETYPVAYIAYNRFNLTSWTDDDASGNFTVGDDFQMKNAYTGFVRSCQVEGLSTDIAVKEKPVVVPEFPLETVLPIALIVAVVYVWWINKRKRITKQQKPATPIISHSH